MNRALESYGETYGIEPDGTGINGDPRPARGDAKTLILWRFAPMGSVAWTGPELPRFWERILDTLEEHRGRLSFHDCLLVLVSREGGIGWIASFDQGFDQVSGLRRVGTPSAFGGGV